jgi:hypothetical protein
MRTLLLYTSLAAAGMTLSLPALAAPLLPTNVANIFSYPAPPAGFNANTASPSELADYGLPPRPSPARRRERARWDALIGAARTRIQPILQLTQIVNGPVRAAAPPLNANTPGATQYTLNWSGEVLLNNVTSYGQGSYNGIASIFNLPVARQAFDTCTGGWDYLSTWAGIDGWNNNDVFQAGTESDAYCNGTNTQQYYTTWVEWYPGAETRITNLPVTAGDAVLIWMLVDGPTTGRAIVANLTTNQTVIMSMTAPAGTTLKGSSAEWIVERPSVNKVVTTMSNYVQAWMSDETASAIGASQNGDFGDPPPGSTAFLVTMLIADYGQVISAATPDGATATVFKDAGAAK